MRFSIYLNPQTRGGHEDVGNIQTVTRQAVTATEAGFDGIALTEHHFSDYNTYGNPFMVASHLISRVPSETMFTIACAVPPLHNPMHLAQQANLLDILTKGNVIVGLAPGGSPLEYAGIGRDPAIRQQELFGTIDIVEAVMRKQPEDPAYEWATAVEHGTVHTRLMPTSYTGTGVKFARATQSEEGAAWTGRKGWYLLTARDTLDVVAPRLAVYRDALGESGLGDADIRHRLDWSLVQKQVYIADSKEAALAEIRPRLEELAESQARAFGHVGNVKAADELKSVVGVALSNQDEFIEKALIIGNPDEVTEELLRYQAAGVGHMALVFNWGYMTPQISGRSLQLFIDDVLPRVRAAATTA